MNIFTKACLIQLGLAAKPRNPHQGIRMFRSCLDWQKFDSESPECTW